MKNIIEAIRLLREGEVVALPTETVYGLAADVSNDKAVAKIYALKNRPKFNPLIIHVYDLDAALQIGEFSARALEYAEKYWPGPLTIVVPKRDKNFAQLTSAGLDTIAIRVPAHPMMREVLKSGLMLAAPSANISGTISPTEAEHVKKNFPDTYILDGGNCEVGLESTFITFDGDEVVVLRDGVIQVEGQRTKTTDKIIAPGMLLKHYAPKNKLRINAEKPNADEVFIGFGNMQCDFNLSVSGDLIEAASNLFSMLHAADARANNHGQAISVVSIPNIGVGVAINDKLVRAAS
jgi:L-threonylcarbamoyladenylate synthase